MSWHSWQKPKQWKKKPHNRELIARNWHNQFDGNFPVTTIEELEKNGFQDDSWGNDASPNFIKRLENGKYVRVWVSQENPSERENPGESAYGINISDTEDFDVYEYMGEYESKDDVFRELKKLGAIDSQH